MIKIPVALQWSLLELDVGVGVANNVRNDSCFNIKGSSVDAVGKIDDAIMVFGNRIPQRGAVTLYEQRRNLYGELEEEIAFKKSYMGREFIIAAGICTPFIIGLPVLIHGLRPSVRKRAEMTLKHWASRERLLERNSDALENLAKPIEVYSGGIDDASNTLGKSLVEVGGSGYLTGEDTGGAWNPDNSLLWLRAQTALAGGNAVVDYEEDPSRGRPVRYAESVR